MSAFDQELELIKHRIALFTKELMDFEVALSRNDEIDIMEKLDDLRLHLETILDSLDTIESMLVEDEEEDYDDDDYEDDEGYEEAFV